MEKEETGMIKGFVKFCSERRNLVIFSLVVTALVYGCRIFSQSVTLDTDYMINMPGYMYNWLDIGRYGLIVTEKIFGVRWYNPYVNSAFAYVTINLFLLVFCYVFEFISEKKNSNNYYVFCAVVITHPVWMNQWIFKLQNFQVAFSILLVAVALGLIFRWIEGGSVLRMLLAVMFMIWSFGSYQMNVILYITVGAAALFLYRERDFKRLFFVCLKVVIPFVCAFVLNQIVVKLFFSSNTYLTDQIMWGKAPISDCVNNIITHFKQIFGIDQLLFFDYTYSILCLILIAVVLMNWKKAIHTCVWKWLAVFFVMFSPFMMTIATAAIPVYRSQYSLPFCCGCVLMYLTSRNVRMGIFEKLPQVKTGIRIALTVFAFWVAMNQTNTTLRLWYTDDVRYEQDVATYNEIMGRIHELGYSLNDYHVAVIGRKAATLNKSCYPTIDVIGWSYFDMFVDTEPQYFYSTGKFRDFAGTRGVELQIASVEEIQVAKAHAASMPSWPAEGSIDVVDNLLVIKLSDV